MSNSFCTGTRRRGRVGGGHLQQLEFQAHHTLPPGSAHLRRAPGPQVRPTSRLRTYVVIVALGCPDPYASDSRCRTCANCIPEQLH